MKTTSVLRSCALAGLAAFVLLTSGCASTPADRAAGMSRNVSQTGKDLEASRQAVSQCLSTLNQLITQPSGDMRSQLNAYLDSVKSLNRISDKVDASVKTMMDNSQIYFADWGNQIAAINDGTLKQLSTDRKQQAVNGLAELKKSIDQVRETYKPLAKDLDDIGLYLGNNLTSDGIAAMKPKLDNVKLEALRVRDALAGSATALGKFSTTLSTPPPTK